MTNIYLDHGASTPIADEVLKKMTNVLSSTYGNPSSIHKYGQDAKLEIELAREEVSSFLNAKPLEICFTSGGTESDNQAIIGACLANEGNHIITSPLEHKAVLNAINFLIENYNYTVSYLSVNSSGNIDLEELKSLIKKETVLVSLMYVNNEIGNINPVEEIGKLCKQNGVLFHTDAVQAVGKLHIDLQSSDIDLLSGSAHKIYGPKGVGFTYIKKGTKMEKIIQGGFQEFDNRAGTENVASIAGLGEAIKLCKRSIDIDTEKFHVLQKYFIEKLSNKIDDIRLNGSENKIFNNINFSVGNCNGEAILHQMNSFGIAISSGSACTSGSIEPSHVIQSLGIEEKYVNSSIRIGLGRDTTKEEIDYTLEKLQSVVSKIRK